ncbi:MAG: hypothetical protein CMH57_05745 [Myxococcales bacterium]|nr:hypothetical protein [Myxococcales bacterium]
MRARYRIIYYLPDVLTQEKILVGALVDEGDEVRAIARPGLDKPDFWGSTRRALMGSRLREALQGSQDFDLLPPAMGPQVMLGDIRNVPQSAPSPRQWVARNILGQSTLIHHDWSRFFTRRGSRPVLDEDGFLRVEASATLTTYDTMRDVPCLLVLGEPGIGKSTVLEDMERAHPSGEALRLDLRLYRSSARLGRVLAQARRDPAIRTYLLDSFDEANLALPDLMDVLSSFFADRQPGERLRLTSRTALWSRLLEEQLEHIWNSEDNPNAFQAHLLAPLTRDDVALAATERGLEPERVFRVLMRANMGSLAARPVTLLNLLELIKTEEELPESRYALYDRMLYQLVQEHRTPLFGVRLRPLRDTQRYEVVSRLAALSLLGDRGLLEGVGTSINATSTHAMLCIDEAQGGEEQTESNGAAPFAVERAAILDALNTGVFIEHQPGTIEFAHRSYQEFLAARYLSQPARLRWRQVRALIRSRGAQALRIPNVLHEMCGWLASARPEALRALLREHPEVLLHGDPHKLDAERRHQVTQLLLEQAERGELMWVRALELELDRLQHAGLADQLRPYMRGSSHSLQARLIAIAIADACQCVEVAPDLATLALQREEDPHLRAQAIVPLTRMRDEGALESLRSLVLDGIGDDPDDEILGYALLALWPEHLTYRELLQAIRLPRENFFGAYKAFLLTHGWIEEIPEASLSEALELASGWPVSEHGHSTLDTLQTRLIHRAWRSDARIQAMPQIARLLLRNHEHCYRWQLEIRDDLPHLFDVVCQDEGARRALATTLLEQTESANPVFDLVTGSHPLLTSHDLGWIVTQALTTEEKARTWALLASTLYDPDDTEAFEHILNHLAELHALYPERFPPPVIELDSPLAEELRAKHQKHLEQQREWASRREPPKPPEGPSLLEQMYEQLEQLRDQPQRWPDVEYPLLFEAGHGDWYRTKAGVTDLEELPEWSNIPEARQRELLTLGRGFLEVGEATPLSERKRNSTPIADLSGLRLLTYFHRYDPDWLEGRERAFWARWAPIIAERGHSDLVERLWRHNSQALAEHLAVLIGWENEQEHPHLRLRSWSWWAPGDEPITHTLMAQLQPTTKLALWAAILGLLIPGWEPARRVALAALGTNDLDDPRKLSAANILARQDTSRSWPAIWDQMLAHPGWGVKLIERLAAKTLPGNRDEEFVAHLEDDQLGALLVWSITHTSATASPEDRVRRGRLWGVITNHERVHWWIGALQRHAAARGLVEPFVELQQKEPDNDIYRYWLAEARRNKERLGWRVVRPVELLRLIYAPERLLVRDEDELTLVFRESLRAFQREMDDSPWLNWRQSASSDQTFMQFVAELSRFLKRYLQGSQAIANAHTELSFTPGFEVDVPTLTLTLTEHPSGETLATIQATVSWHRSGTNNTPEPPPPSSIMHIILSDTPRSSVLGDARTVWIHLRTTPVPPNQGTRVFLS